MWVTVLMVVGFVVAILAILGLTPRLEEWATSAGTDPLLGDRHTQL